MEKLQNMTETFETTIKWRNRFIVRLPESLGIAEWWVMSCTTPTKRVNGQITVKYRVPFMITKKPSDGLGDSFDIKIEYLDSTGMYMGGYDLKGCRLMSYAVDSLNYNYQEQVSTTLTFSYESCEPNNVPETVLPFND